ncbi:MAG: sigma-54 dependent transcriptional regulator [Candidatus Scalindua rubra]|uniref:Sigma 54 response regulator n=1 Tax=Candidatus Scalindua brodae TaxID=237368 RepID=A0A0B0EMB3_9BACT|nr:MAG: sigma 54 response regulator [Candidatus Scalindua brodae]MBZ0107235.1 sigma-54 dependent transcriptional regulator [Candidatus Scalindua rubra]
MSIEKILVVDDDDLSRGYLSEALQRNGYSVDNASDGQEAVSLTDKQNYDMLFLDMRMPRMGGMKVLERVKKTSKETTVVIMTAYGSIESAVEAMQKGAYDYIIKPFSVDNIELLLKRVQERQKLIDENKYWRSKLDSNVENEFVIDKQSKMFGVLNNVKRMAQSKASVLIQGESGTGKEIVAHSIYTHSQRNSKPFIKVNCAALSESLLESELFGHEKGAFTGADLKRMGRFELANGGTLLLDEISEVSPKIQAKLLRVLEQEEFERVGGVKTLKVDVRIIATTNRDLGQEIEKNNFRQDLYFRLNVIPVIVPPLRERREDIPVLAEYFLEKFKTGINTPLKRISKEAIDALVQYDWPGNVREIKNLIHRCTVMIDSEVLLSEHFENMLNVQKPRKTNELSVGQTIEDVEKELIYKTLEKTGGNKTRAAEILDVTPRTLRNKLSRYKELQSGFGLNIEAGIDDGSNVVEESFSH